MGFLSRSNIVRVLARLDHLSTSSRVYSFGEMGPHPPQIALGSSLEMGPPFYCISNIVGVLARWHLLSTSNSVRVLARWHLLSTSSEFKKMKIILEGNAT
jgi:hypothetical protein